MSSVERGKKRKRDAEFDVGVSGGHPTRTIPSIEVDEVRRQYEKILRTRRHIRAGTVHLGPEMLQEHTDAAGLVRVHRAGSESESGEGASVARESVLGAAGGLREVTPTPPEPRDGLDVLIAALDRETLSDEPPPYLPSRIGERFEGMMRGGTLEMKLDPGWLHQPDEKTPEDEVAEVDVQHLTILEGNKQVLPNSYHLSDEEVSRVFAEALALDPMPEGEKLIAVGRIARLEARIVDHFATLGRAYRELVADCEKQHFVPIRRALEKLGILNDPDVLEALRRWRESGKPAESMPASEALKPVRVVGAYVVKKRGEILCRLQLPRVKIPGSLVVVQREVRAIRRAFDARRGIIDKEFGGNKRLFATSFLVQRGPNARPGFFWNDETCLDL